LNPHFEPVRESLPGVEPVTGKQTAVTTHGYVTMKNPTTNKELDVVSRVQVFQDDTAFAARFLLGYFPHGAACDGIAYVERRGVGLLWRCNMQGAPPHLSYDPV
jgi:hypothetical protein